MKLIIDLPDKMYENIKKRGFVSSRYNLKIAVAVYNGKPLQEELEEIKAEMHKNSYMKPMGNFNDEFDEECRAIDMDDVNYILDKRISELKGENNEFKRRNGKI